MHKTIILLFWLLTAALEVNGQPLPAWTRRGSIAQVAFGTYDCLHNGSACFWDTDLIFTNIGDTAGIAKLKAYSDDGSVLLLPIVGQIMQAQYQFSIPSHGSLFLDIDETVPNLRQGWIDIEYDPFIRGQGIFTSRVPTRTDYQAAIPILTREPLRCIIPFPGDTSIYPDVLTVPVINTNTDKERFVTSVAFANITDTTRTLILEFDDEQGNVITTREYLLPSHGHIAFATTDQFPESIGRRGLMRVVSDQASFTALGFLFNSMGPFTSLVTSIR